MASTAAIDCKVRPASFAASPHLYGAAAPRASLSSPPLSLSPERAAAVLRAEPSLVARTPEELDAVAAALASAGVAGSTAAAGGPCSSDLALLVEAWPRILTKKAADVGVKARLATEVLGASPRALARSPRLLFDRSVSGSIGPRFAFYRAKRRGAGKEGGEEEEEEEWGMSEGEGDSEGEAARETRSSSSSSSSSSSLSPSTLLRGGDTDFCLAVGGYGPLPATVEEFSIFRRRWEAEAERGLVAEGLAEEKKRRARSEQRRRRRQRRQRRSEEAAEEAAAEEAEEEEGEREEAAAAVDVAAAAAVAAALAARNLQQKQGKQQQKQRQQQQQQQWQKQQRPPQKPEAAGAALEAIATLRTKKKEGGGSQK